jgi:O-antigen/teichoic acid export membrane protein
MNDSLVKRVSSGITFNVLRVVISIIVGLLYSIIAVRWLQVYNFGVYAFLNSIFSGLAIVYVLGTHSVQTRFIPELMAKKDFSRLRRLVKVCQKINFFSAFLTFLAIFASAEGLARLIGQQDLAFYIRLMSLGIIPGAVLGIIKNILNALYDQKFLSIGEIGFSLFDFSLLVLLVVYLRLGLTGAILLPFISLSVGAFLYYIRLKSKHKILFGDSCLLGDELKNRVIKYAIPLMLLDLFNYFASGPLQNLFLGFSKTMFDVTFFDIPYSFIETVFSKIWLVIGGLGLISLVEIKTSDPSNLNQATKQYTKLISLYTIPITVGGFILAGPVLITLYGSEMAPAIFPFQVLIIALCLIKIFSINQTVMLTFEKSSFVLIMNILSFVSLIALDYVLIPSFGIIGAIIALLSVLYVKTITFTYITIFKLKIGNFIPTIAIIKYAAAASLMGILLFAATNIYDITNLVSLILMIIFGLFVYVVGLKLVNAFDEKDREIILKSNIPFKKIILKLI